MNIDGTSKKKISENCKINSDIEGFLFDENLTKLIIVKLVKVEGLQVKKGNDAYPDCECHPIWECDNLIREGGALNCCTWNIMTAVDTYVENKEDGLAL